MASSEHQPVPPSDLSGDPRTNTVPAGPLPEGHTAEPSSEPIDLSEEVEKPFIEVTHGKRRRQSSLNDSSTISYADTIRSQHAPSVGLVVLFVPTTPNIRFDNLNPLKLTETLESLYPSCILEARINKKKNILAVDTRNGQTTGSLLRLTSLCGITVRGFEPRGTTSSVGMLRDVDASLSDENLLAKMRSSAPIRGVRRMGKSSTIRVEFESAQLPQYVYLGLVRHEVLLFVERPLQCHRCGYFGHVSTVCKRPLLCLRCGGSHTHDKCEAPNPHCVNCGKSHEATSIQCSHIQHERSVCRFRATHNVSFVEARAAVNIRAGSTVVTNRTVRPPASSAKARVNVVRGSSDEVEMPLIEVAPGKQAPPPSNLPTSSTSRDVHMSAVSAKPALKGPGHEPVPPAASVNTDKLSFRDALQRDRRVPHHSSHSKSALPVSANDAAAPCTNGTGTDSGSPQPTFFKLVLKTARDLLSLVTLPWARALLQVIDAAEPFLTSFFG